MSPKTCLIMGRSGAGKGTQARLLSQFIEKNDSNHLPIFYVETGGHFRRFIENPTYTGRLSKVLSEEGFKQPDFLAVWNWADLLIKNLEKDMHLIMDGSPRSLPEAQILDEAFSFYSRENPLIIYINVSSEWANNHLKERGRIDDEELHVHNKTQWFDADVVPAINFFRNSLKYKFVEINGEKDIEEVHEEIISTFSVTD